MTRRYGRATKEGPGVARLQSSSNAAKTWAQYDALRRDGRVVRAVVVAERTDGGFSVLGNAANPTQMARLLVVAAEALAQVPEGQRGRIDGEFETPLADPAPPHPPRSTPPATPLVGDRTGGKPVFSLAGSWASFETAALPVVTGAVQRREMRRAYYAGAAGMLGTIMDMLDPGDDATEGDLDRMDALHDEILRFGEDLKAGRA
jgi:hypothetical protein